MNFVSSYVRYVHKESISKRYVPHVAAPSFASLLSQTLVSPCGSEPVVVP
jgi:hypothetical protein